MLQALQQCSLAEATHADVDEAIVLSVVQTASVKALLYDDEGTVYVTFKYIGREPVSDLSSYGTKWKDTDALVHRGFLKDFMEIETKVTEELKRLFSYARTRRLALTGHSVGGALAQVALLWYREDVDEIRCVSFGSPKLGNAVFANLYKGLDNIRVASMDDAMTHVPNLFAWWKHPAGTEILLGETEIKKWVISCSVDNAQTLSTYASRLQE